MTRTKEEQELYIKQLEQDIANLKEANTKYLDELETKKNQKPEILTKIMEIANKYGLNRKQKEELINNAIKMADDFRRQNKKGK